ncbi:MAG: hypothetical protein OXG18_03275 [Gemmatimonadetes bacterium]|nr:hypothetical protein [Gemmatimonadota bacterium]
MSSKPTQAAPHASASLTPPNPDPFGWEVKRRRQAERAAEAAQWAAEAEAAALVRELEERIEFSMNEHRILFALVTLAADPHLPQAPALTAEQWAQHFNIRPTQVTYAFRHLHQLGIPKPPTPIRLGGWLRFLADKLKAEEPDEFGHTPEDMLYIFASDWIMEYVRLHEGGTQ